MARRRQSARSRVIEVTLSLLAVFVIWLWMTNGGPKAAGEWIATMFASR